MTVVEPGTEIVQAEVAAPAPRQIAPELDYSARLGMWLAAAESKSENPQVKGMAAALRIEYAKLIGLPPHAASEIHVIKGNLSVSAKLCRALAHERGIRVERVELTAESCTARVVDIRTGESLGETTYTLEQAKQANLVKPESNWTKSPDRMLWARASKRALDDWAPWVTVGVMTEEDVEDAGWENEMRASIAASGAAVVDVDTAIEASKDSPEDASPSPEGDHPEESQQAGSATDSAKHGADPVPGEEPVQESFADLIPESARAASGRTGAGTDPDA